MYSRLFRQGGVAVFVGLLVAVLSFVALVLLSPDDGWLATLPPVLQVPLWLALRQGAFLVAALAGGIATALLWPRRTAAWVLAAVLLAAYAALSFFVGRWPLYTQLIAFAGLAAGPLLGNLVVQRLRLRRARRRKECFSWE
ncbi:hypothetical protein GCM10023184_32430 [Flaviaesturariibacter amylovorans]|uniref:DUF4345 domain-containing protein n=1 Tax=Flaviaesturariibacter amylovorans TaxID=1084520 RepID=A0ABP8HB42_9BACT